MTPLDGSLLDGVVVVSPTDAGAGRSALKPAGDQSHLAHTSRAAIARIDGAPEGFDPTKAGPVVLAPPVGEDLGPVASVDYQKLAAAYTTMAAAPPLPSPAAAAPPPLLPPPVTHAGGPSELEQLAAAVVASIARMASPPGTNGAVAAPAPPLPHRARQASVAEEAAAAAEEERRRQHTQLALPPVSEPLVEVFFDLGRGGRAKAYYHEVAVSPTNVILVYDTRYRGSQYAPPALPQGEDVIEISLPELQRSFRVLSIGISNHIGYLGLSLDVIVLGIDAETTATLEPSEGADIGHTP